MADLSFNQLAPNCYEKAAPISIFANSLLNIFGGGEAIDPVGCLSSQIAAVQAEQQAFLNEMTFNMFEENLVIAKQQIELSTTGIEYNQQLSEYYYSLLDGKFSTISAVLPMVTVAIFVIFFYIATLPN